MIKKVFFQSKYLTLAGNLLLTKKPSTGVLCLHGGGVGSKERYRELQNVLSEKNISSFAIDFQGVGGSEGNFEESTLLKRLENATAAFDYFQVKVKKIVILGTSMGGHIAVRLTEKRETAGLILLYSAAYSEQAENKHFNNDLTNEIRKKDSWKNSPIFNTVQGYPAPAVIVYGRNDTVIPKGVQDGYKNALSEKGQFIQLPHASHVILNPKNSLEEQDKQQTFKFIINFVRNV